MTDLTSTLAQPWALVAWGGSKPGARPRTRLAYLTKATVQGDRVIGARGHTVSQTGAMVKTPTYFLNGHILQRWTHKPSAGEVDRAKQALPIVPRHVA